MSPHRVAVSRTLAASIILISALALLGCSGWGARPFGGRTATRLPEPRPALGERSGGITEDQAFDVKLAMARTLERQGELEQAEAAYRALRAARPNDPTAAHRLAVVCERQGKFDESDALFRTALAGSPSDATLLTDMGYSLYRRGRWTDAEDALRKALALQPSDRRAQNHLGLVLCQTGRRDEAIAAFRKAGCTEAQARMNVALVLTVNDRFDEARAEYAAAQAVDPRSTEAAARGALLDRLLAEAGRGSRDQYVLTSGVVGEATPGIARVDVENEQMPTRSNIGRASVSETRDRW
jgi:Flp pilus assembly protein TadD